MNGEGRVVLLVEDELHMRRFLHITLKHNGFHPIEASTGKEGVELARTRDPAVVLLDLRLPDIDGMDVTRGIRRQSKVPIIVISARESEDHKIAALDGGADDYLTKPFAAGELLARIRVALRHRADASSERSEPQGVFVHGGLRVDFDMRRVVANGKEVHLTPTEYKLLSVLIAAAGKVVTHRHLLERVWGTGVADLHYLRVYMQQLRGKIEPDAGAPRYLVTEPAVGYRLRVPD
jgi:two-component system KDP operon response regulator KdpE